MITGRASSTFELYLIKNSQTEDYDLGANLSEPEDYREYDAFDDVQYLFHDIAEELLKDCEGQKNTLSVQILLTKQLTTVRTVLITIWTTRTRYFL